MSRHVFAGDDGRDWTVGWEERMVTFFAQVDTDDEIGVADVAGVEIGECTTVESLEAAIAEHTPIPDEIREQLVRETPDFARVGQAVDAARVHRDQLMQAMSAAAAGAQELDKPGTER
ncbi:MAG: hypothetical protein KF727_14440 [Microbacteriaceae bacterium]|nr:hypothetical protein [Microbacteriaceae bacterium]